MPDDRLSHIIVFVSDMKRSVQFYSEFLGMHLRFESPKWTEYAAGSVVLALHHADRPAAAEPPKPGSTAGRCQFGLTVKNLDEFHKRATGSGVRCLYPPTQEAFGGRLAAYADPDGQAFSVWEEADSAAWEQKSAEK